MIISKAPLRISLFGGGTDVAPFCERYGGLVLNFTINIRNKITINDKGAWQNQFSCKGGGLGSSGSHFVALVGGLYKLEKKEFNRYQIAKEAFNIEIKQLGWYGGCQDHFAAAFGGFNLIEINKKVKIKRLPRQLIENFLPWMVLFDTQIERKSFKIQESFKSPTREQTKALMMIKGLVIRAKRLFFMNTPVAFTKIGKLLNKMWEQKKLSNKVSNKIIDNIYDVGMKTGAIGGKLLGAGQGGHFLFICEPDKRKEIITKMEKIGLKHVDFGLDFTGLDVRRV